MQQKPVERPPEYPAATHKVWTSSECTSMDLFVSAKGTPKDLRRELTRLSVWERVKPVIDRLKEEAKKNKVESLTFEVQDTSSGYDESPQLKVTAIGFRPKTEKERIAGELAREKNRAKREAAEAKKVEAEKKQLLELQKKYPEVGRGRT